MIDAKENARRNQLMRSIVSKYEAGDFSLTDEEQAFMKHQEKFFNKSDLSTTPGAWNATDKMLRDLQVGNGWNRFQHQHRGKYTKDEMREAYKRYSARYAQPPRAGTPPPRRPPRPTSPPRRANTPPPRPNQWNTPP